MAEQRRAVPARALLCLLLVLGCLGAAAPSARAEQRVTSAATSVQDHGRTPGAVRLRQLTRPVAVSSARTGEVVTADRLLGGVVLGAAAAGGSAGSAGSASAVGTIPVVRPLVPLLLGQLPRPPTSTSSSRHLSGSPSRAPPAVAGT